ncbi:DUF2752 domain-containing protein [Rhodococcus sp. NPDC054953]
MSTAKGVVPAPAAARVRGLAGPAGLAFAGVAFAVLLRLRDPRMPGAYGFCPFRALTGLWCPGCGGLRAAGHLTNGEVLASLASNPFVAPLALVLVLAWLGWVRRRWRGAGGRMIVLSPAASVMVLAALGGFTIVRNTPWGSVLAPT